MNAVHVIEKVKIELDGSFYFPGLKVAIFPVERVDRGTVTPVVAIFVIPGQLLTGAWIIDVRFFRKRAPCNKAIDLTELLAERYLPEVLSRCIDQISLAFSAINVPALGSLHGFRPS